MGNMNRDTVIPIGWVRVQFGASFSQMHLISNKRAVVDASFASSKALVSTSEMLQGLALLADSVSERMSSNDRAC